MENSEEITLSENPTKNQVIKNIINSTCKEQFENSKTYAALAGMLTDEHVQQWVEFKEILWGWN